MSKDKWNGGSLSVVQRKSLLCFLQWYNNNVIHITTITIETYLSLIITSNQPKFQGSSSDSFYLTVYMYIFVLWEINQNTKTCLSTQLKKHEYQLHLIIRHYYHSKLYTQLCYRLLDRLEICVLNIAPIFLILICYNNPTIHTNPQHKLDGLLSTRGYTISPQASL